MVTQRIMPRAVSARLAEPSHHAPCLPTVPCTYKSGLYGPAAHALPRRHVCQAPPYSCPCLVPPMSRPAAHALRRLLVVLRALNGSRRQRGADIRRRQRP